jgi:hypothetical protein
MRKAIRPAIFCCALAVGLALDLRGADPLPELPSPKVNPSPALPNPADQSAGRPAAGQHQPHRRAGGGCAHQGRRRRQQSGHFPQAATP